MTYGHLQADCLYTTISSGPNARYRVWEAFTFFVFLTSNHQIIGSSYKHTITEITSLPAFQLNSLASSHPGQLSLLHPAGQEMSKGQSAVTLCGWGVKAVRVYGSLDFA